MSEIKPRAWWSTALVTIVAGLFGGLLWIGAGWLAVASFVVLGATALYVSIIGAPVPPAGLDMSGVAGLASYGFALLSVLAAALLADRYRPTRWYSHGFFIILVTLVGGAAALGIRTLLFQPLTAVSSAMEPTLQPGDYVWVSKSAYGYSRATDPFGLATFQGRIYGNEPKRGDVVALNAHGYQYIERVVGLPGETVQMIGGVLNINGTPVTLEDAGPYQSEEMRGQLQRETLPNGVSYAVLNAGTDTPADNTRLFMVPTGNYFVMGDNRDNSNDSRSGLGVIAYEDLVGKAVRIYWNSRGVDYSARRIIGQ